MDQAYIRWQNLGHAYKPDLVLFAFQPENLDRNVNVFRPLYYRRVAVPFSKPRFVLHNDQLALLNVPTVPTAKLKSVYSSFASHPLAAYESHYESHEFVSQWWAASRLASFINALVKSHGGARLDYGTGSERGELGKAIVDAFAESVKSSEAEFIVVHLPQREHLQNLLDGNVSPFSYLLNHINENYRYVDMVDHLGSQHTEGRFYDATHHYGPGINHLVARTLAGEIAECVKNASCRLPRFADTETLFFHRQELGTAPRVNTSALK